MSEQGQITFEPGAPEFSGPPGKTPVAIDRLANQGFPDRDSDEGLIPDIENETEKGQRDIQRAAEIAALGYPLTP